MKEIEFNDMSPKEFREAIEFFADNRNEYSREDLYSAFVVVTRLYLDELISARQLENYLVKRFGEASAEEFFETVATGSETVKEADTATVFENEPRSIIKSQFDLIEELNKDN